MQISSRQIVSHSIECLKFSESNRGCYRYVGPWLPPKSYPRRCTECLAATHGCKAIETEFSGFRISAVDRWPKILHPHQTNSYWTSTSYLSTNLLLSSRLFWPVPTYANDVINHLGLYVHCKILCVFIHDIMIKHTRHQSLRIAGMLILRWRLWWKNGAPSPMDGFGFQEKNSKSSSCYTDTGSRHCSISSRVHFKSGKKKNRPSLI